MPEILCTVCGRPATVRRRDGVVCGAGECRKEHQRRLNRQYAARKAGKAAPAAAPKAPPPSLFPPPVCEALRLALREPQVVKAGAFVIQVARAGRNVTFLTRVLRTADEPVTLDDSDEIAASGRRAGGKWRLRPGRKAVTL